MLLFSFRAIGSNEASFFLRDGGFFVGDGCGLMSTGSKTVARLNDGDGLGSGDGGALLDGGFRDAEFGSSDGGALSDGGFGNGGV